MESNAKQSEGLQPLLKDHEIARLVNEITSLAKTYHSHQSLRQRISQVVNSALKVKSNVQIP